MTAKAIDLLKTRSVATGGPGFYLQVEGALIDKRSHANDAAQTLQEIKTFDDAVKIALDFAKADGNTDVIVTADHECAGFNIIEHGTNTNAEDTTPPANNDTSGATVAKQNRANDSTLLRTAFPQVKDANRSAGIYNDGANALGANNFAPATFRTVDDPASVVDGTPQASLWLSYLSGNHTGADVPVFGYGPDASPVEGSIDNTDLFKIMGGALGVMPSVLPTPAPTPTVTVTETPSPAPTVTVTAAPQRGNSAVSLSAPAWIKAGVAYTFTANVGPANATGTVEFTDSGVVVKTVTVTGGVATASFSLPAGVHPIRAVFRPTSFHWASSSSVTGVHAQ
jgi:alkaline phosphatase